MQETQAWSLGWEDPLEREMTTHCGILAWRIPWTEKPGGLWSMRSQRVRHNSTHTCKQVNNFTCIYTHIYIPKIWNSNILATWCEELTWKRPWCWEKLKAGEGDNRGWDGWMASATPWTWLWASSRNWWWTGNPDMLQSMGSQEAGYDWETELNWIYLNSETCIFF